MEGTAKMFAVDTKQVESGREAGKQTCSHHRPEHAGDTQNSVRQMLTNLTRIGPTRSKGLEQMTFSDTPSSQRNCL